MMAAGKELKLPDKVKPQADTVKLLGPQHLRNDIIDWAAGLGCGWPKSSLDSGDFVIKTISHCLWYLDHCHDKMKAKGFPMPAAFQQFQGYHDFQKSHHKAPVVQSTRLTVM